MNMNRHQSAGFTLIEVLVVLVILAVGLLGLSALQQRALQAELESYQRAQALILVEDMANRIETNQSARGCYDTGDGFLGTGTTTVPECSTFGVTETRAVADADLTQWHNLLLGSAEQVGTSAVGGLIDARGCIVPNANLDQFTITVVWRGLNDTVAPTVACASDQFATTAAQRRAVSRTVRFGT